MLSVIVLVYNETKEHIESVINKIPREHEVIVVDNRPHWQEYEITPSRDFSIISNYGNLGAYNARWQGFQASSGDKIWFINGDDDIDNVEYLSEVKPNTFTHSFSTEDKLLIVANWETIWSRESLQKAYDYFEGKKMPSYYCEDAVLFYYSYYIAKDEWTEDKNLKQIYVFNNIHYENTNSYVLDQDAIKETLSALKGLGEDFKPLYNSQYKTFFIDFTDKKFKHDFKYDIAITVPIYKIKKERIATLIEEIKQTFRNCSFQIVLSDNRPVDNRDCNLSEFDDDIVSHVDNGGNIYALKARMSAFEITDAYYIWSIDDDNYLKPEGNDIIKYALGNADGKIVVYLKPNVVSQTFIPSAKLKEVYEIIKETTTLPLTYFEDALPLWLCKGIDDFIKIDFSKFYSLGTESWTGIYGEKSDVKMNELIPTIESIVEIFGSDSEHLLNCVRVMIDYFNFSDEDYWELLSIIPDWIINELGIEKLNTMKFCINKQLQLN